MASVTMCPLTERPYQENCGFYNRERKKCCIPEFADCVSQLVIIANAITSPNYENMASINIRG